MPEDADGVQWAGRRAVVKLPQHVDSSNADQVRERLLWVINRGAVVLVADMTATLSCDYSGADAVVRTYRRAVASGIEFRLVVTADVVRRTLSLSGLHRLVSLYPSLQAALGAGPDGHETLAEPQTAPVTSAISGSERLVPAPADPADRTGEVLDSVVTNVFAVALSLQEVTDLPRDLIVQRITEALDSLDGLVRGIRSHMFAQQGPGYQPGMVTRQPPDIYRQVAHAVGRAAVSQEHLTRTARAVQTTAAETAALLTERANLIEDPKRIDYPTEIKRWSVVADKAQQIAERWEESPPADF